MHTNTGGRRTMGKPSKGTSKDMRLKANKPAAAKAKPAASKGAAPKFGSPAWRAKYGK